MKYRVAEIFESINGEGRNVGELAVFVRFAGCNLNCSYCDTAWANIDTDPAVADISEDCCRVMSDGDILNAVSESGINRVTLTGGEPLIQPDFVNILTQLFELNPKLLIEIETNGSVDIAEIIAQTKENRPRLTITMDYKLTTSGMQGFMTDSNFELLGENDVVKFVAGSRYDLIEAVKVIEKYDLLSRCSVYFSPVADKIAPDSIVDFMKEHKLNGIKLQLQLHKYIWSCAKRGV